MRNRRPVPVLLKSKRMDPLFERKPALTEGEEEFLSFLELQFVDDPPTWLGIL